jgi:hypothetical protein
MMSEWVPVSEIARRYGKHSVTIKRWCKDGFILHLGFRIRKDPKGQWFLCETSNEQSEQSKPNGLTK